MAPEATLKPLSGHGQASGWPRGRQLVGNRSDVDPIRMALSLGIGFSGVILPTPITVSDFLELFSGLIEQREGFRPAFDSAWLGAPRSVRHLVASDGLEQFNDELLLLLF